MKLLRSLKPLPLFMLAALLYTGCNRPSNAYIYMAPTVFVTDSARHLYSENKVSSKDLIFEVKLTVREVRILVNNSLPGNRVYAKTSPVPVDKITDIRIKPFSAYNATHASFDDISGLCQFAYDKSFINLLSKYELIDLINDINIAGVLTFYGHLKQPPSGTKEQQFIVEFITDKNARLADTTIKFILQP